MYCWFVRGRIKDKIDTIYAIKHQVYCINYSLQLLRKQPPLITVACLMDSCHFLKWIYKGY